MGKGIIIGTDRFLAVIGGDLAAYVLVMETTARCPYSGPKRIPLTPFVMIF